MIRNLQNLWHKMTAPRATDEDEARREYFVNVILVGIGAIDLVYTLVMALAYYTLTGVPLAALLAGVVTFPLSPLCLWLSRRGWWRVVALVPILALLVITVYSQYRFGHENVTIVAYGALVIIAEIVYGGRVAVGVTLISVLSYGVLGWLQSRGLAPPTESASLEAKAIVVGASLAIIVMLQRFFTSQLQEALLKSRTFAQELRSHRNHLEELVEERTVALTEANAQLHHEIAERMQVEAERERLLAAERAQARRQAALFRLSAELAATLDEAEVCRRVVDGLHDTLGYDTLGLYLVDEATGDRVMAAVVGFTDPPVRIPPGQGLSERPLLDGRLQYTPDVTQDPRYFYGMGGAEVDVPVRIGGKVLGVLIAESKQRHTFNRDDFEVLTAAAQQAGLAIEKARLLAAERQRADELDALRTTMSDITAELELPALLQAIVERAAGLLDATGGELGLYDGASQEIRIVVSHNMGKDYVGTRHGLGEGAMGRVADSGEALIIEDYHTWEGRALQYADIHIHASMAAPLMVGSRLVGAITIADVNPARQFGPADLHLLKLFAQQAAIAIENAHFFEAEQRRAEQFRVISEVGRRITSILAVDELLGEIARLLKENLGYYLVGIGLIEGDELIFKAGAGAVWETPGFQPPRLKVGQEGITGWVAQSGQPLLVPDVSQESRYYSLPQASEMQSELAVPLKAKEAVIGVLHVQSDCLNAFDESDIVLLQSLAHQAAIAIENARLYADLRASQEYARNIIDSSLDPIIAVDRGRRIVEFNRAAQETFGYRPEEILGQHADVLYADLQEGRDIYRTTIEQSRCIQEVMNRRKNGEAFPSILSASLLRDARGELVGVMGISRDITERKQAEAELRRYQEHLEERVEERTADLRESEERYRTLFDGVPVGLYRSTPAGQMVDANLAFVQMLGYPSQEDLQAINSASLYVDPEDRVRWQALMEREGVVRDFETQQYRYDGTVIWVNETARAIRDEQGQVLYYEGSIEDISERKRAEAELRRYQEHLEELVEERTAELRESEERYRTLFDGVPVGLYRTTPEGQILDVNRAFVQMSGCPDRETLLGLNADSFYVDPEDRVRWQALMEREGVVRDFEVQHRVYDGTIVWNSDTARAVMDEQGQVLYYEGSLEDVTERKKFEGEIRRQKEYFEALFVNSPVAALTADLDVNVVSWNPMAEKLFGYTQQETIGQNVDDLVANDPLVREEALRYTNQAFATGRVQATTKRTHKDGSFVDVEVLALPVVVAGEDVGFIVIYHDISPLQQARRAAEAANQAKSAFLANMSHELRTPLNAILGFTQLMDRDPNLTAEQQENLGIINRSGEHLLALINDVLEMSKIEAGRVTLQEKSFDLHHLLDSLEEMFRLRTENKGLALNFERDENVPQYVRADEGKLRQILSNLLGNAVKFTQEGGVALRVRQIPNSEFRVLNFKVKDTGPGITPQDLAAVFDPFVQATTGQQFQEGTGLGLSISRQYVRLMGGDITVTSELGRGSLFEFDVPVELADPAEVQAAQHARRVLGLEPNQPLYRLLVAEDKETNRQLLVKLLKPLGFEVKEVVNGQEAIEIWERWEPHLIWMDMRMPVMDGYEATRRIKATTKGQATVIIALTATAFEEDRERVLLEGCDDFVRKPFRKDEIFDMLAKHLGVRFVYDKEQAPPAAARPADAAVSLADVLTPAALAALPAGWVADLQQATIKADLSLILTLIGQIRGQNPALADALADLAHDFEYKEILMLIQEAGERE